MRLLLVTDAWHPQVNGVVRTLTQMRDEALKKGWEVVVLGPEGVTIMCPTYPEIRLTLQPKKHIYRLLAEWQPNAVHIATEGPLGWAMRGICVDHRWPFTTSFHTRFPEYLKTRFRIPRRWTYRFLRHFHYRAERILVPTASVAHDLRAVGLTHARIWGRGVDTRMFTPNLRRELGYRGPVLLYVGRLAIEKNIDAFLRLKIPGTKVVVGEGPERARLEKQYPDAVFLGLRTGAELASLYASADVFVFPSLTDTFGLVTLEALACGTPVAAFPASGPLDVLTDPGVASIDHDLARAITRCLGLDRSACRAFAEKHSWSACADVFLRSLEMLPESVNLDRPPRFGLPLRSLPNNLFWHNSRI